MLRLLPLVLVLGACIDSSPSDVIISWSTQNPPSPAPDGVGVYVRYQSENGDVTTAKEDGFDGFAGRLALTVVDPQICLELVRTWHEVEERWGHDVDVEEQEVLADWQCKDIDMSSSADQTFQFVLP